MKTYYAIQWDSGIYSAELYASRERALRTIAAVNGWCKRVKMKPSGGRPVIMWVVK